MSRPNLDSSYRRWCRHRLLRHVLGWQLYSTCQCSWTYPSMLVVPSNDQYNNSLFSPTPKTAFLKLQSIKKWVVSPPVILICYIVRKFSKNYRNNDRLYSDVFDPHFECTNCFSLWTPCKISDRWSICETCYKRCIDRIRRKRYCGN